MPGTTAYAAALRPLAWTLTRSGKISGASEDNGTATIESNARFCTEFETMTAGRRFPISGGVASVRSTQMTAPRVMFSSYGEQRDHDPEERKPMRRVPWTLRYSHAETPCTPRLLVPSSTYGSGISAVRGPEPSDFDQAA